MVENLFFFFLRFESEIEMQIDGSVFSFYIYSINGKAMMIVIELNMFYEFCAFVCKGFDKNGFVKMEVKIMKFNKHSIVNFEPC